MINCRKCREMLIDYLEEDLDKESSAVVFDHLARCLECSREYEEILKLGRLLDKDKIDLPSEAWFESARIRIRKAVASGKKKSGIHLAWAFIPAAVAAMILLYAFFPRKPESIDFEISTSYLLEDDDIAAVALRGLIDEELINDLDGLETWELENGDYVINDMSREEKDAFIKKLNEIYLHEI